MRSQINTFTDTTVRSILDKVCQWETDKAVNDTHRTTVEGNHTFHTYTRRLSRYVVWSQVEGKVQRQEYQTNNYTHTTTRYIEYYQCSPLPTYDELVANNNTIPAYV